MRARRPWWQPGSEAAPPLREVSVSDAARAQLRALCEAEQPAAAHAHAHAAPDAVRPLRFFAGRPDLAEETLVDVLRHDPRSVYRKKHEQREYLVCLDGIDVACVWEGDAVRVVGASMAPAAALRGDRISDAEART